MSRSDRSRVARVFVVAPVLLLLLLGVGCVGAEPAAPSPTPQVASPTSTPQASTPTQTPLPEEPTLTPSPRATRNPAPTATATPTPIPPGCVAVDPVFEGAYEQAQRGYVDYHVHFPALELGCPTAPARSVVGAVQRFRQPLTGPSWRLLDGIMIWRSDTRNIYAIQGTGGLYPGSSWILWGASGEGWIYPDTWTEGMPEVPPNCANMTPPSEAPYLPPPGLELRLPIRGFGKVWCENMLWEKIGWATENELLATLTIQPTEHGIMMIRAGHHTLVLDDKGRALLLGPLVVGS